MKKKNWKEEIYRGEQGYVLVLVLVLMTLASLVVGGSIANTQASLRTQHNVKQHSQEYYKAESGVARGVSWLRQNSQQLVNIFRREEFYAYFTFTDPTVQSNDHSDFSVPTLVKVLGSNDGPILSNDASLADASFPTSFDITTNDWFNSESEFASAALNDMRVRITLVNVIADIPSKDYGPPPAAAPETDFYPVYRIDSITPDSKAHVYGTVLGDLAHVFDVGIYGQDYLEIRQPCDSYNSSVGAYGGTNINANCPAGSNSTASLHQNENVYGSLQTNGDITSDAPYGGDTCADFLTGCPNPGEVCAGEDCGVPLLEIYQAFDSYCDPADQQAQLIVTGSTGTPQEITLASSAPADTCWVKIKAGSNKGFKLTSTNAPYYIKELDLHNNAVMYIEPDTAGKYVELYVETITGGKINGNQSVNMTGAPTDFRLIYLGADALDLNGTADMRVALVAPNATVTVSGTFEYYGALLAQQLYLTGNGGVHYDEALGGSGPVNDVQFRLKELVQYYR